MSNVKKPCIGCIYFKTCGNSNRTVPCLGRETLRGNKLTSVFFDEPLERRAKHGKTT